MEKYTASYANTEKNFVFQNLVGSDIKSSHYGLFCVLKNIVMRNVVTKPSEYLKSKLGELNNIETPLKILAKEKSIWNNLIKGDKDTEYYPAKIFLEEIVPAFIPELPFLQNLFVPEVLFSDIIEDCSKAFIDQQVDFYLPQAKLVVEIDGLQHLEKMQLEKDNKRDEYLKKHSIKIVRIETHSIENKATDISLKEKMLDIKEYLQNKKIINEYSEIFKNSNYYKNHINRLNYDTVMRFQILILVLLQRKHLDIFDKEWNFDLNNNNNNISELFYIAFEDVFNWLENLCQISKMQFNKPVININRSDKSIKINFDIFKFWTDENELDPDAIYIRNDYFFEKDYFRVSISKPILYNVVLNTEQDENIADEISMKFFLKNIFDYEDFNEGQLEIIAHAMALNDTIGILPTGSGKSLCYQFCCLLQPTVNFVVEPILSLIYDQKDELDKIGIGRTEFITSDIDSSKKGKIIQNFGDGKYFLVWISPERFQTQKFREKLQKINLVHNFSYAVIDEVHCLSEWGHDFRTSYLNLIKTIHRYCTNIKLLGLTATASQFVLQDLKNEFGIESESIKSVASMNRSELTFHIHKSKDSDKYLDLVSTLKSLQEKYGDHFFATRGENTICGLIFTVNVQSKRKNGCADVAPELSNDFQIEVKAYSSGVFGKDDIQKGFKENKFPLMTATKAFGMGVNKKNINYTIHYGLPWSIEAFYQEAGRAGRKKQDSDCYILYVPEDCDEKIINEIFAIETEVERIEKLKWALHGDLFSIFNLWLKNNKGVEEDLKMMRWVMNELHKNMNNCIITCDEVHTKSKVEKAIYKLTLLGFVKDWTIGDWGEKTGSINIDTAKYTEKSVHENFIKYVRRYYDEFSLDDNSGNYNKYIDILKNDKYKAYTRYMHALVQWSYDNIVYNRKQTIKNIFDICRSNISSNDLKIYVDNYFKFSEITVLLDNIISNPNKYELWFDVLKKNDAQKTIDYAWVSLDKALEILPALDRYLESYRFNTGLNFVAGILWIMCGQFLKNNGSERFDNAFNTIETFSKEVQEEILNFCLDFGNVIEQENRWILGGYLSEKYPDKVVQIYEKLKDYGSLTVVLQPSIEKMKIVEEKIIW